MVGMAGEAISSTVLPLCCGPSPAARTRVPDDTVEETLQNLGLQQGEKSRPRFVPYLTLR